MSKEKPISVVVSTRKIDENYKKHIIELKEVEEKCDLIVVAHGSLIIHEYKYFINKGKKIVKLLLDAGADITATTKYGSSILDIVEDSYNQELKDLFDTYFEEKLKK